MDSVLNPLQVFFQRGVQTFIQHLLVKREFKSRHYNILHYIVCLEAVALRTNDTLNKIIDENVWMTQELDLHLITTSNNSFRLK